MDNPYRNILGMMQEQGKKFNPPSICLGEILSVSPLTIKIEDLILDQEDLLISDILVDGYKREVQETSKGNLSISGILTGQTENTSGGSGDASFESHNHAINTNAKLNGSCDGTSDSELTFKTCLKTGDLVALMPTENRQIYIVLCKVVSL